MNKPDYPIRYYFFLFLMLLFSILLWLLIFYFYPSKLFQNYFSGGKPTTEIEYWNQDYLPKTPGKLIPIDSSKIIKDSLNRKIVSNLVNIAIKNSTNSIARFANDLKQVYPSNEYKIVYIDSVVNRLQVQLPENERVTFKSEVKNKLSTYKLLVWDETLFNGVKIFEDPQLKNSSANWYLKAINIDRAWNETTGDKNTVIAVIDNGFDINHPELKNKAVKPYNIISKSANVEAGQKNHGTHVASTIVANGNNNEGLVGICPECSFMPIKVEDQNGIISSSYVIDAILYAIKNNANVVNLSLGLPIPSNINISLEEQKAFINSGAKDEEEFWNDLFAYANEKNITCVLSAGNSNILTGLDPFQRSNNTIKVGAINPQQNKAIFSNFGPQTTVYAPGTAIFGAKPGNNYEYLEGTSMAAPIVSGFVGLIKSKNKNLSNGEIAAIIKKNTKNKNNLRILDIVGPIR